MAITIDVKKGDTILVGKFKNKKMVIKDIGVDKHGMPTINGRKATTFRIHKKVNIFDKGFDEKIDRDAEGYGKYDDPDDERYLHVQGRKPCGNITIANSDAGASAMLESAIDQAHRAVSELHTG